MTPIEILKAIPEDITPLETANLCKFNMWIMGIREPEHFSMFIKEHNIERLFKEIKWYYY